MINLTKTKSIEAHSRRLAKWVEKFVYCFWKCAREEKANIVDCKKGTEKMEKSEFRTIFDLPLMLSCRGRTRLIQRYA